MKLSSERCFFSKRNPIYSGKTDFRGIKIELLVAVVIFSLTFGEHYWITKYNRGRPEEKVRK
jgi:hypothetical protein